MSAGISSLVTNTRSALDRVLHPRIFWVLLLIAASVPAFLSVFYQYTRPATLWFTGLHGRDDAWREPVSELRFVAADGDITANAIRILEELFLGPIDAKFESLTIPGNYVQAALLRKNVLYIDLSTDILFGRELSSGVYQAPPFQPSTVLALAGKTLAWNFPGKRIVLTVGGYEASWEPQISSK